jgi:hypothetical protein
LLPMQLLSKIVIEEARKSTLAGYRKLNVVI